MKYTSWHTIKNTSRLNPRRLKTHTGHIEYPTAVLDLQVGAAQGAQGSGGAGQARSAGHVASDGASGGQRGAEHAAGRGHGQRPLSRHVRQSHPRAHCGQQRRVIKRLQTNKTVLCRTVARCSFPAISTEKLKPTEGSHVGGGGTYTKQLTSLRCCNSRRVLQWPELGK